jgi:SAM-dependent methyltransferase
MTTTGTPALSRERPFFADPVREYAGAVFGRPLAVLRAGSLTPLSDLGLERLISAEISVTTAETDLGTAPLRPRTFDIVYCALLLERISNVEVVLDRLAGSLRPGGLLLLRFTDRNSAVGLLDRTLPGPARRALWHRYLPDTQEPFPAVYESAVSARGIQAYTLMRGFVITARATGCSWPAVMDRTTRVVSALCRLISWATRDKITAGHDELLYVIRKPEDRFARVVLFG